MSGVTMVTLKQDAFRGAGAQAIEGLGVLQGQSRSGSSLVRRSFTSFICWVSGQGEHQG